MCKLVIASNPTDPFFNLYVFEEKIIAADIASHTEGWQRTIDGKENMG